MVGDPARILCGIVLLLLIAVTRGNAQVDEGWGSDETLCPAVLGIYTVYNEEQFSGKGFKERETFFWGRYKFVAHNQGGAGPIEMSGFFYISKAQCYLQEGRGVFYVVSPVIESYGPRRDDCGGGGDGTEPVELVSSGYDPYAHESNGDGCGSGGGGEGGGSNCTQEFVIVERSDDGGNTWYTIYQGWITVCP